MERITADRLRDAMTANVSVSAVIMTDELKTYRRATRSFKDHVAVEHGKGEYVRGDAHTNTVEGFFSILKRGVNGVYHHVSRGHLARYCDEFAFRYENRKTSDGQRAKMLVAGAEGKRLTYKQPAAISA